MYVCYVKNCPDITNKVYDTGCQNTFQLPQTGNCCWIYKYQS